MPIRTLIVDDTILYRKLAGDACATIPGIEVVGTAASGDIALMKMAQISVDLVFCDVYMPGKNGVETLAIIKEKYPDTFVVMMSSISTRNADITIQALQEGAIDFISKPDGKTQEENMARLKRDMEAVVRLVNIKMGMRGQPATLAPDKSKISATTASAPNVKHCIIPATFGVLAIGVSTGGPEALTRLIPKIPENIPVPIVLVQHMPPDFTRSLALSLDKKSQVRVVEGEPNQVVEAGKIYIAPGGYHMVVRQHEGNVVLAMNQEPPENSCRPAVDVLFRSVANVYGDKGVLAVILTGMGSDGCNGVRSLKRKGCYCITQAADSCVVYGMPRAVDEAGLSDISLPLEEIVPEICKRLKC